MLVSSLGTLAQQHRLYDKLPYDPDKDFASVTQIAYQPPIIVGRTDLPYKNIKEMVEYAKANPGKINRGSPGAAILTNLAPIGLREEAGISTTHIPFNGDAPAVQALLSDQIDIHGTSITGSLPHIKAGKLRVLGVMDTKRLPQVPDAPTFKEQGYDIEAPLWYSLSVPAGTPKAAIDQLNKAVNEVIADPAFVERARAIGMEPRGSTPEELDKLRQGRVRPLGAAAAEPEPAEAGELNDARARPRPGATGGASRAGPVPRDGGPAVRDGAGRPRRRRDQGRASGARRRHARLGRPHRQHNTSYFNSMNRNKRSVALDLQTPEGQAAGPRTGRAQCDVVIQNFKYGGVEKMGLGYEQLKASNPRLIYCSISGYDAHRAERAVPATTWWSRARPA